MDTMLKLSDIISIAAVIISPVAAVIITLFWQSRKEKRARKDALFSTLMMHRRNLPPTPDTVNSLNLIDVVFADNPKVIGVWHEYYQMLVSAKTETEYRERDNKLIELLSAMAEPLGYKSLKQIDINKFYIPQGHVDQQTLVDKINHEWLRVLENTNSLALNKKIKAP
jgi:hypothetical protein